jgi:hypothetical protein
MLVMGKVLGFPYDHVLRFFPVSTADELRDQLREMVKAYLHWGVNLSELEYQPSAD